MSYQRIGDETTLHASHERRLFELERKLLEKDDAPPAFGCCDSWCDYLTGAEELNAGATTTLLSVAIPRPRSGRISAAGYVSTRLLNADGDYFWTARLSYGGTLYEPRARFRNTIGKQSDESNGAVGSLFDFQANATDLTVGLFVHNASAQTILITAASLTVDARGRGGSVECSPPLSGTGA